jgi:hypothetical protein
MARSSQGFRSSNTPRLRCRTKRLDVAALHIYSPRCPAVSAVSGAEPPPHSPATQIDAEAVTAPGTANATVMQQRVPLRFYPSASRRPRLRKSRLARRRSRDAFHPWGDDRCAGKRHVMAILAVGSVLILEIVQCVEELPVRAYHEVPRTMRQASRRRRPETTAPSRIRTTHP